MKLWRLTILLTCTVLSFAGLISPLFLFAGAFDCGVNRNPAHPCDFRNLLHFFLAAVTTYAWIAYAWMGLNWVGGTTVSKHWAIAGTVAALIGLAPYIAVGMEASEPNPMVSTFRVVAYACGSAILLAGYLVYFHLSRAPPRFDTPSPRRSTRNEA